MKSGSLKKHVTFLFFLITILFSFQADAQKIEPIKSNQGEVVTIYSNILKEDRRIMIYTPRDSVKPEKRYPVIYVLDADNHFAQMVEYAKYLSRPDVALHPQMISSIFATAH